MLVHLKEILDDIAKRQKAVGAFNTINLEISQAIVAGARQAGSPAIMQLTENVIKYAGLETIFKIASTVIKNESGTVPLAIHLDHGKNLDVIKQCVDIGFSSVHCDASAMPFEDNLRMTREVVSYAHQRGVCVQGELGSILGKEGLLRFHQGEDLKKFLTDPSKIGEFVEKTGIDTVAVSIGNLHGSFAGMENLDLPRLQEIKNKINIPIVLHGGSGIATEQIKEAIKLGIRVINIDTELRIAFAEGVKSALAAPTDKVDPREILGPAKEKISAKVAEKIVLFIS